jgi:predicted kinase
MARPTLFLMLGYPGAGKTTAAKLISSLTGAQHLWADHVRREMYHQPTYSHAENMHLYTHLNDVTRDLLADSKSVVFDTNFNFYRDRQYLKTIATNLKADTILVWVQVDKNLAKQRATDDAHMHSHTRVLGRMSDEHFDRIAKRLEVPRSNETVVVIDGSKISEAYMRMMLRQAKLF